jgi:quinol monooxygenase YgiN
MITVLAKLTAQPGKEADMQAELEQMVRSVEANEPGVVAYSLHTVEGQPGTFYFYEQYEDEAALQAHGQTDHMKNLGAVMRDMAAGRPEITRLNFVTGVER